MTGNCHVQCGVGEKAEIISNPYLSLLYSFRGSDPSYIRDFLEMYQGAERLHLSTNYRCKKEILDAVIPSIESNVVRVDKEIKAFDNNVGGKVFKYAHPDSTKISEVIRENTKDILDLKEYGEHAILVRTNNQRMILTDILAEQGVQVDIGNISYSLRKNSAYRSLVGIIKAIKEESNVCFGKYMRPLLSTLNYSVFKEYEKSSSSSKSWFEDIVLNGKYNLPQQKLDVIDKIRTTSSISQVTGIIWKEVKPYYENLEKKGFGNIKKVEQVYKYVYKISKGVSYLTFLETELKKENFIQFYHGQPNAVKIHTFHSVKGLEFDNVYLIGLNNDIVPDENYINGMESKITDLQILRGKQVEGTLPYERLTTEIEKIQGKINEYIEEERRLFYVAWTRAKNELHYQYNPRTPSMFIDELNTENVEDISVD